MSAASPELPREPGWYRVLKYRWERITDEQAQAEMAAGAIDLVHVDPGPEEDELW